MKQGKHKSMDNKVKLSVRWLERYDFVQKVILGASHNCRHKYSPGTVRITRKIDAGFKVNLYGGTGVTTAYIYTDHADREELQKALALRFDSQQSL